MQKKSWFPSPFTILMIAIVLASLCTWLLPAGSYDVLSYEGGQFTITAPDTTIHLPATQRTLDSLHVLVPLRKFQNGDIRKPLSVPGTYRRLEQKGETFTDILQAPIRGMYETIDIILLVLFIGGFIRVFTASGAIDQGIGYLCRVMNGKEHILVIALTALFALGGTTFGMAEEGMAFYPLLIPVFLAAGFDRLVPVAVIYMGTSIGNLASVTNPFATIIASDAAGVNWTNGTTGRVLLFVLTTTITIWYTLRYIKRVRANPAHSLVARFEHATVKQEHIGAVRASAERPDRRAMLILLLFMATFVVMVTGVVMWDWWLLEMTTLFLVSSLVLGFCLRMKERVFVHQFIQGAESLLSVALIIGIARGITIVLNEGRASGTLLYYCSTAVQGMPPALFIVSLLFVFILLSVFLSSSSGLAVLTMPIIGPLAAVVGVPSEQIVNAYLYGFGIMSFITPTGLVLPALAMVDVSLMTYLRFIWPLLLLLTLICMVFLVVGVL